MQITVNDLYALESHAGVDVIKQTHRDHTKNTTVRVYSTTIGDYYSSKVRFAHLIGYLYGKCYVAIRDHGADKLSPHLVKVTKEAQRRDAAYFEEGRNEAIDETHG